MKHTEIEAQVLDVIQQNMTAPTDLATDTNFVQQQLLDSFAILSMIMQLEQVFAIKFTIEELADETLQTAAGLSRVIAQKVESA